MGIAIRQQQGAVLAVTLVMLLVMTLIAVSGTEISRFELRMSQNMTDKDSAFQASESALRGAETWLNSLTAVPQSVTSCSAQPCVFVKDNTVYFEDYTHSWWITSTNAATYATSLTNIITAPRYVVEYERFIPDDLTVGQGVPAGKYYYRVTSRGTGLTDLSQSILETTFSRRF